jgi:hypothetical protein
MNTARTVPWTNPHRYVHFPIHAQAETYESADAIASARCSTNMCRSRSATEC